VEVTIPAAQTEAMRDLERAREDAIQVERVARQQLDKFLLRHGCRWSEGSKWTLKHWKWIKLQAFPEEASRRVLSDYLHTLDQASVRVQRLTADISELVERWTLGPLVRALHALRGVDLVTAVVLAAQIGNFQRFRTPKQLMAYLGLVRERTLQWGRSTAGRDHPHGQSPCALGAGGSRLELPLWSVRLEAD
jgi:transposase